MNWFGLLVACAYLGAAVWQWWMTRDAWLALTYLFYALSAYTLSRVR